jgi:hypothetical protein
MQYIQIVVICLQVLPQVEICLPKLEAGMGSAPRLRGQR